MSVKEKSLKAVVAQQKVCSYIYEFLFLDVFHKPVRFLHVPSWRMIKHRVSWMQKEHV